MTLNYCPWCQSLLDRDDPELAVCQNLECQSHYPPALLKAAQDPFDYALQLSNGQIFRFSEATLHGDFVHLDLVPPLEDDLEEPVRLPFGFARGVDVRISEIVWCADAPDGS